MAKIKLDILPKMNKEDFKKIEEALKGMPKVFDKEMKKTLKNLGGGFKKISESFGGNLGKNIKKAASVAKTTFKGISVAGGVAMTGLGLAATGTKKLVEEFASFDKGIREVTTLLGDFTGEELDELRRKTLALAKEMNVLPEEVVPALYQALSAGIPKENVFEFLKTSNKASVAGVASLSSSVELLTTLMNSYKIDMKEVGRVSDMTFNTVKNGVTTFSELGGAMGNVLSAGKVAGVNLEELFAGVAVTTKNLGAGKTSESTTKLRALIEELNTSDSDVAKFLKEKTGKSFSDYIAGDKDLIDVLELLKKSTGKGFGDLFSSTEARSAANIAVDNAKEIRDYTKENASLTNSTEKAYAKMEGSISRILQDWEVFKSTFTIELGEEFAPVVTEMLKTLKKTLLENKEKIVAFLGTVTQYVVDLIPKIDELMPKIAKFAEQLVIIVEELAKLIGKIQELPMFSGKQNFSDAVMDSRGEARGSEIVDRWLGRDREDVKNNSISSLFSNPALDHIKSSLQDPIAQAKTQSSVWDGGWTNKTVTINLADSKNNIIQQVKVNPITGEIQSRNNNIRRNQ